MKKTIVLIALTITQLSHASYSSEYSSQSWYTIKPFTKPHRKATTKEWLILGFIYTTPMILSGITKNRFKKISQIITMQKTKLFRTFKNKNTKQNT